MFGNLSQVQIEEVLKQQYIGRLGCHADDITYVVPISYAYDGVYIYGRTFEGMKIAMMRKNPKVCFQADHMADMANWQSVICWGQYEELNGPDERNGALRQLLNRSLPVITSKTVQLTPQWPFLSKDVEGVEGIVFRILLTSKTGRFESNSETVGIA